MAKYIGKILDGRWKVTKFEKYPNSNGGKYTLKNIYNDTEKVVCRNTLVKIFNGELTVSKLDYRKIKEKRFRW